MKFSFVLLCWLLPTTAFALGWEQVSYVTLSKTSGVVRLSFSPTMEQESRGQMVYSSKESRTHRFCVPNMAEWDSSKELRCGVFEIERSRRIYRALPENKKSIQEARRIFALHQKDKKRCDAGEFAGYLYCTLGCESDRTKLLVKVEYTECIDESHNR